MAATKLDLKKADPGYYKAPHKPVIVDIPETRLITYAGEGAPEGEGFERAMGALYSLAYTIKFMCKSGDKDFVVPPVQAYWWVDEASGIADNPSVIRDIPKDEWTWKAMIRMPDFVTDEMFAEAQQQVKEKKGYDSVFDVKFETLTEGLSVHMLHVGPYAAEVESVESMLKFMKDNGLNYAERPGVGPHLEIYLSDPRRAAPEKLRTIIRIPVEKA